MINIIGIVVYHVQNMEKGQMIKIANEDGHITIYWNNKFICLTCDVWYQIKWLFK